MSFRFWCREKWFEHCAELESYGQKLPYSQQQYFDTYKWWLKREYRHQVTHDDKTKEYVQ
jgi:hypothetical protein